MQLTIGSHLRSLEAGLRKATFLSGPSGGRPSPLLREVSMKSLLPAIFARHATSPAPSPAQCFRKKLEDATFEISLALTAYARYSANRALAAETTISIHELRHCADAVLGDIAAHRLRLVQALPAGTLEAWGVRRADVTALQSALSGFGGSQAA